MFCFAQLNKDLGNVVFYLKKSCYNNGRSGNQGTILTAH